MRSRQGVLARAWQWARGLFRRGGLKRSIPSEIEVYADGFVPASQFTSSGNLETLYEATTWSYACICTNAIEAASLGAQVQRREEGGRWIRTDHRELQALIDSPSGPIVQGRPSEPPQWTWPQLVFLLCAHAYLDGNAYLYPTIVRGGRRVYSVVPLLPDRVAIQEDAVTLYPQSYSAGGRIYRPDELVHVMFPSPLSFSSGHAPIQAALRAVQIDYTAGSRVRWNLENKVAPGLVVTTSGFMGMTDEQRTTVQAFLSENYAGASKDGRPLVFGDGTKVVSAPSQIGEIDYASIREQARDEILAAFRTPPPVVGVYDDATLNNFATAFKLWWQLGLFPLLKQIYTSINLQLIAPIYGPDIRLWYDDRDSEIALVLERERAETAKLFVDMGVPPARAMAHVGIDIDIADIPELDVPLQNLALAGREPGNGGADQ